MRRGSAASPAMWGAALPLLWALAALASDGGYTTFGPRGVFYEKQGDQTLGLLDHTPTTHTSGDTSTLKRDKRGDCMEGEPCPVVCLEGLPCLHKNCSKHFECDGAFKCCKTLCGARCILPEFKQPCKENHQCPESTTCCDDGTCDSHCPLSLTAIDGVQEDNSSRPTMEDGNDPHQAVQDSNDGPPAELISQNSNGSHTAMEDSSKEHHAEQNINNNTQIEKSSDSPPTAPDSSFTWK